MPATPSDITVLLERSRGGDAAAREQVFAIAYEELRRVASNVMRAERLGHTLSPTAVVNETYLRLVAYDASFTRSRRDFFALCSTVMRHVLADHVRQPRRTNRARRISLHDSGTRIRRPRRSRERTTDYAHDKGFGNNERAVT